MESENNFREPTALHFFRIFANICFLYVELFRRATADLHQNLFGSVRLGSFFNTVSDAITQLQANVGVIGTLGCGVPVILFGSTLVLMTFVGFIFIMVFPAAFLLLFVTACIGMVLLLILFFLFVHVVFLLGISFVNPFFDLKTSGPVVTLVES